MAITQTTLYCKSCGRMTLHQKSVFGVGWGLFLTFVTGGFFIPFWLILAIVDSSKPFFCLMCDHAPRGRSARPAGPGQAAYPPPGHTPPKPPAQRPTPRPGTRSAWPCVGVRPRSAPRCRRPGPFPRESRQTCPNCRAGLPLNARFCRDCGTPLAEAKA
jgi:hypothetical protein